MISNWRIQANVAMLPTQSMCSWDEIEGFYTMSTLSEMKTELFGIGNVLKSNLLSVPKYQRSYAWMDKNVKDLFDDLKEAIRDDEQEYFLGSIVAVHTPSSRLEVVDGQQRLATTVILLSAIRDHFLANGEEARAEEVEREYMMKRERRNLDFIPNLQLNEMDHEYFHKRVLLRPDDPGRLVGATKESHVRIDDAARMAAQFVHDITEGTSDPINVLNDWMDYIDGSAKVIWVRVRDDANAFTIFETLNDRGLALAITDLLKNLLFSKARDRLEEVQQRWVAMTGVLEPLDGNEVILNYVRHFWSSKHGVTRKNDLYSDIKAKTTSRQRAIDLASELYSNSHVYEGLINPDAAVWGQYDPRSIDYMSTLNLLGMVQIRPLLLAVLATFTEQDVNETMKRAVCWAVRFLVVGNLGGGVMEAQYSRHAVLIRSGQIENARQLSEAMRRIVPNDVQFRDAFETVAVSKFNIARYYLRTLDLVGKGNTNPALIPNSSTQAVNLEHILPQNPSEDWHIDRETAKTYYNRLGNLALLETKMNRQLQNRPFEEKADTYRNSVFKLTNELGGNTCWGVQDIQDRQRQMARLAASAWPI